MFKQRIHTTFSEISIEWLEIKKTKIKYSSYIKYENLINRHLINYFNRYDLLRINSSLVSQFFQKKLNEENLSVSTLKTLLYILKSIIKYFNDTYHYSINISNVELPSMKKEIRILNNREIFLLEKYCFENINILSLAILLSLYGGLRIGEICALKTENINLNKGMILVSETVQRIKSQSHDHKTELYIGTPKTQTSYRFVPIPKFLNDYIKEHYMNYFNNNTYFLSQKDIPIDPRCIQKQFQKICKELDINLNFHALRHTYATNCVQKGVDIKSLSEIMGHSSVNITLNLYVHSSDEYKIHQIEKINKVVHWS